MSRYSYDLSGLKTWVPTTLWVLATGLSIWGMSLVAPTPWLLLFICTLTCSVVFGGFAIYNACAQRYVDKFKNYDKPPSYRAQVRHLKREIKTHRNKMYSLQNWSNLRNEHYTKMLNAERKLANLLEEEYVEPARKPVR